MWTIISILVGLYCLVLLPWGMYLAVMNLIEAKHKLTLPAKIFAYPLAAVGICIDFLTNLIVGSILFLDIPREWLLTARLQRYLEAVELITDSSKVPTRLEKWRWTAALWICTHLLDPFDSRGFHCRKPK